MIRVSWSQSKSRACGGALSSGNIANSAEGSLPFRCARILLMTAGSSMQAMILTYPVQRSQVSMPPHRSGCGPIKHPLEPLHPGHRLVALRWRLVQPVLPGRLTHREYQQLNKLHGSHAGRRTNCLRAASPAVLPAGTKSSWSHL